ncbi:Lipopolysaccharide cholinephosphotransferase LicD [Durusdinium trenchii]|uniref:Lipopolysaccharide cholinephosphotransferase LicD n=1 Tax=Durusdinium trenchii TaxID=1381693 RepID=A0ABP0JUJ9_9DINO
MRVGSMTSVCIVALLGSQPIASTASSVEAMVLMQSRLRGSKTSDFIEDAAPKSKDFGRYSDDDESCTTEGLSPGVCALSSLARPLASKRLRKPVADCDENESREGLARAMLERALVAKIEAGLVGNHSGFDTRRLQSLEKELRPLYSTLPHEVPLPDIEGGLGLVSARYLLHQYFLRRHSWQVRGLNPAGDGRQPPDHKEALRSRVAGHLLELLERKVGAQGLNLKTLAVFVATLEHLLHGDERQRLKQSWTVHDLNPEDLTDAEGLQSVLEVFMAHFVYSSQKAQSGYALTLQKGREEVAFVGRVYDGWSKIRNDIRNGIKTLRATRGTDLSFEDAVQVADQVLEYFRDVSGSMCRDMAESLVRMPGGKQGKVPLSEMRKKDLFRETMDYLRAANALDESTRDPVVLVPNYMLGPSNCDGTTSFYDLCCPDPCEGQRAFFEEAVMDGQPAVAIEQIAREQGASSRMLPKLHQLLERQAALHGHDFSMWFHEAFPDRCPRPLKGDAVPDAKAEFQATAQVESLFEW